MKQNCDKTTVNLCIQFEVAALPSGVTHVDFLEAKLERKAGRCRLTLDSPCLVSAPEATT